ncbi:hypothetical protein GOODEAATRI_018642, partial [Goodea atripinnis]
PSEGYGGEQGALRVAGSLQTLQRSGLRAAGHHRLQSVVQDVNHPKGALLGRRAGAGHLAAFRRAHSGCVLPHHVGDLCALPLIHGATLGSETAVYLLLSPPFLSLSALSSAGSPVEHLSWPRRSVSGVVLLHLRLIYSHRLFRTRTPASSRLDPTR